MNLDILTLMAAGSFVSALSAVFLFGAWTQMRREDSLLWWSAGQVTYALGVGMLMAGLASGTVGLIVVGATVASCSPTITWAGARSFARESVSPFLLSVPVVANVAAGAAISIGAPSSTPTLVGFALSTVFLFATVAELLKGRDEPLPARWPLIGLLCVHGLVFVAGFTDVVTGRLHLPEELPPLNSGFGVIHFESLLFSLGAAVCMALLAKERSELRYMLAAHTDTLTGLANRGAFFARAERLLARCRRDNSPLSVVIFDLDHFKQVNDGHGHAVGDRVLCVFADVVVSMLRPNDLAGRQGGEEFGIVLPGTTVETAYVIADRIRHAFGEASGAIDGFDGGATVSGGVAEAWPEGSLIDVVDAADAAMYRAKDLGRNRIARATSKPSGDDHVIRVA